MGPRVWRRVTVVIFCAAFCGVVSGQEKLSELQARFDAETSAVHKAKMLQHLGDAQFEEAARAQKAGNFTIVGMILEKYRDNVAAAAAALEKQDPDGEHHPAGYKQLEMHVQKGLRELDEYLLEAPDVFKPPLQIVRQDLLNSDDKLLRCLFPPHRRAKPPDAAAPTGKPADPGAET